MISCGVGALAQRGNTIPAEERGFSVVTEGTGGHWSPAERNSLVSYPQHVAERTVFPSVASSILMTAPTVIIF